jgi:quercetin dioxygenase-like cupin family protein
MDSTINIVNQNEGPLFAIAGGNYRIVISGVATNGNYAVIEMTVPPGGGPPPHEHPAIQEMFYILEGEVTFKTEAGMQLVGQNDFVNIPLGGGVHCFKNTSDAYARLLCTVVPAGLEHLFEEIGTPVAPGEILPVPELTEERKAFLKEMDQKYGIKTYPPFFLG